MESTNLNSCNLGKTCSVLYVVAKKPGTPSLLRWDLPHGSRVNLHIDPMWLVLSLLWCSLTSIHAFSILSIDASETLGVGGGSSIYITGTDLGDPFNAPVVLISNNPNPTPTPCIVQSFTSTATRIHCKVDHTSGKLPALAAGQWGLAHEKKIALHVIVNGREAYCDNGKHIGGTGLGDCRLTFDVGGTPLVTAVLTPSLTPGELLRVQALSRERIDGWHASNASDGYADSGGVEVRLRHHSVYAGCVLRDEAGNAVYNPLSAVPGGAVDSHRVGCRVQPDAADAAGFWDVEMRSASVANRGYALVASSARRIDLRSGALYDIELMPRIASVTPTSISPAGGALLTIAGTGFGANSSDLVVSAAGAACTVRGIVDGAIICKLGDLPPADPATAVGETPGAPFVGERGVGWHWWRHAADADPAPDSTSLATLKSLVAFPQAPSGGGAPLSDFAMPSLGGLGGHGCGAMPRCAGSRLSGWLLAPVSAQYSFVVRADAEAELWWSSNQSATPAALLASSLAGAPLGAWESVFSAGGNAVSSPVALLAGERYWLELLCAANATECAVGMRVHVHSPPPELAFSTRTLAPRARTTGSCAAIAPAECCGYYESGGGGSCFPAAAGTLFADTLNQGGAMPSCASSEWLQANLQSATAFAPCPFPKAEESTTPSALGANASAREQLPLNEACSSITHRARCCGAVDGRGTCNPSPPPPRPQASAERTPTSLLSAHEPQFAPLTRFLQRL